MHLCLLSSFLELRQQHERDLIGLQQQASRPCINNLPSALIRGHGVRSQIHSSRIPLGSLLIFFYRQTGRLSLGMAKMEIKAIKPPRPLPRN